MNRKELKRRSSHVAGPEHGLADSFPAFLQIAGQVSVAQKGAVRRMAGAGARTVLASFGSFLASGWVLMFALVLCAGCSKVKTVPTEILKSDTLQVRLLEDRNKDGTPVPKGYSHPWATDPATLDALLQTIHYRENLIFFRQEERQAFPVPERGALTGALQEAFARATPDQLVDFSFVQHKRWVLFQREYRTDGVMFVKDGMLNVAFRNVAFEEMVDQERMAIPYQGDPTEAPLRTEWALEPQPGQTLVQVEDPGFLKPKTFKNWIRLDLANAQALREKAAQAAAAAPPAPAATAAPATPVAAAPPAPATTAATVMPAAPAIAAPAVPGVAPSTAEQVPQSRAELQKQLEFLDQLHSEGALPDSSYQSKKQELLERLKSLPPEGQQP